MDYLPLRYEDEIREAGTAQVTSPYYWKSWLNSQLFQ